MGMSDRKKPDESSPAPGPQPAPPPPAGPAEYLEAVDAFGRRQCISRDEYRTRILPELVKAHGNDADRLTGVILQAVRDGFAEAAIAAANRLTVIDKNVERSLSVLALVQRDCGELDSAEATLKELQQKRPQSPAAKVGLGMLAERRGDLAACERLLWEALQMDPNHADAVHGWLQARHRQVGDAGYRPEVEKVAALPGSWRGRLWLARWLLHQGDTAAAATIYREVLAAAEIQPDAMVMAAADLVQQKQHALVAELLVPRFQAGRHHPHAGLALLHHYLQQQDHVAGEKLLHELHLHYGHLIGGELQPFTAEFDRMRLAKLPPLPPLPENPRLGLYRIDRPVWYAGLGDPTWLLPTKGPDHKHVVFVALSVEADGALPQGREDEIGRLSRSVPLFLAEQVWLSTPHRGTAALPIGENGGWAILGRAWPEESLLQQVPEGERASTLLVTGMLRFTGEQRRIDLWVYDCGKKQRLGHAAAEGTADQVGDMLLQLLGELWPAFGGPQGHKPPVGEPVFWHRYADGLGQLAALVVTQVGGMPRERLYGERYITQWLQNAAIAESRWQPGFLAFASALGVLQQLGSKVPLEHARMVAEVFRQSPPASAFARLGVVPLRAAGLDAVWQARRPEIVAAAAGDQAYAAWLARVENAK
jgi:tetratricopeptide (TPR) repeat protein